MLLLCYVFQEAVQVRIRFRSDSKLLNPIRFPKIVKFLPKHFLGKVRETVSKDTRISRFCPFRFQQWSIPGDFSDSASRAALVRRFDLIGIFYR